MRRRFLLCWAAVLLLPPLSGVLRAEEGLPRLKIMTEVWVPYQYEKGGRARGIAVEVLLLMLERAGSRQGRDEILFYPWTRGYRTTLNRKNTLLFLTTRTREREKLFKWVGPLFKNTTCLIARKDNQLKITSPADLNRYTFGTVRDDVGEQLLLRAGVDFTHITRNISNHSTTRMLQSGRLDFVVQSFIGFCAEARSLALDPNDFECVYELNSDDADFAFNRETPDWIIARFQQAFNELEKEGRIAEIFHRYGETR